MLEAARDYAWTQLKAIKPAFFSKKPHFNFITVHYFWIISATIIASIAIYASGRGKLSYIDALMFGSGANTQAGLNPVDLNTLNGFQQAMIYIFSMISNPVTLNACVVFLRLYWFEKRFQTWVREIRSRRPTLTKSRSKSVADVEMVTPQRHQGVNGRHITIVPQDGRSQRITNDGILLEGDRDVSPRSSDRVKSDESDSSTVNDDKQTASPGTDADAARPLVGAVSDNAGAYAPGSPRAGQAGHMSISFANIVKRSDGMGEDALKVPHHRSNAEHIAILERQRNQDNEILRIPGPRDIERGLGPRRLQDDDLQDDDDNALAKTRTTDSRIEQTSSDPTRIRGRQPTITIAEPSRPADRARTDGRAVDSLRFRNSGRRGRHEGGGGGGGGDDSRADPRPRGAARRLSEIRSALSLSREQEEMPYLSYTPTMARNSNFVGLTLDQREELGGIEYRSLRTLAVILLLYFWGFQLIILSFLWPFILHNAFYGKVVEDARVNRTWWAFFTSNAAFMDVGFTLTPDSMISFQTSEYVLIIMWFFIIIGNTGFPVMLRFLIWVAAKVTPRGSGLWEELRFLLDHPRRCFTLMFPSGPTWWLFWILIMLNVIDLVFFIVLDLHGEPIDKLSQGNRVVIGLFQAASTRTAGFSAVSLGDLHPAMPVLYMIMMYISVFPIAISIRRTNVYEERSLGVYHDHEVEDEADSSALSYVGSHLRRQLSFDLWYVFLGFFILAITEGSKIQAHKFELFAVLFEVVSAYGTVGLSMGAAGINASLCSQFSVVGKLVIIAMQIRGRHRGLPYGLDRAVLLPSESRFRKEAEAADSEAGRSTGISAAAAATGLQRQRTMPGVGRSMSRERERTNSNLISQFLHPGPVVHRDTALPHPRPRSIDSYPPSLSSPSVFAASLGPRTQTEPVVEMGASPEPLTPSSALSHHKRMRSETSGF
ncbi:potassium transporter [Ophiocordyceps camponoti-floridani]|uniref:Potassium transport protein n=1 Tax=Ophiocordyceps camponoti-floridani TaxID=2030778 RepID=A0A8H4Q4N8_9HYPO|nr:potassium transporter [Ophiocordyceps camponoti-floridani]